MFGVATMKHDTTQTDSTQQPNDKIDNVLVAADGNLAQYIIRNRLVLPHDLSFTEWDSCGCWLAQAHNTLEQSVTLIRLFRADWWTFGKGRYKRRAYQARAMFGVSAETVANDASEVVNVADACRDVEGATFEQMAGVRYAPADVQPDLLRKAVAEGWSRDEVARNAKGKPEGEWQRSKLLSKMQNAYNALDDDGRDEFHNWYTRVRKRAGAAQRGG